MNEKNDFAMVPRPPTAIEKAEPGAKRVLSSMVADAFALAKPPAPRVRRIVILDDVREVMEMYLHVLNEAYSGLEILKFAQGDSAWEELSRADPDLLITDITHPGMPFDEMLTDLAKREVKYPILVISATLGMASMKVKSDARRASAPSLNVSFMPKPILVGEFINAVEIALRVRAKPSAIRVRRIVILDDEPVTTKMYGFVLNEAFSGLDIVNFTEGDAAWRELSRADPDLLITDVNHTGMKCSDMLARLAEKGVRYHILVISGYVPGLEEARRNCDSNLNVSFIQKPFRVGEFIKPVEAALRIRARQKP